MKILYLNSLFPPDIGGGAEITLESIVRGIQSLGHDVTVVATSDEPGTHLTVQDGVPVYRIGIRNIYWPQTAQAVPGYKRALWHLTDIYNPLMAHQLAEVVDKVKPDIVSVHNLSGFSVSAYSVFKERNIPILQVLHDYYLLCPKVNLFSNGKICETRCSSCKFYRLPHNNLTDQVTAVVGVSHAALKIHLDNGAFRLTPIKKTIHNARNLKSSLSKIKIHHSDNIKFGFIGTLSEVKGVEPMIDAFLQAKKQSLKNIEMLIAGTGKNDYTNYLTTKYKQENIYFLGRVKPEEFFAQIDISIVPSVWNEPLGGVVFESLGYGVPVIGASRGGIPEMISDGVNGLLFDPDKDESLIDAILLLLNNEALLTQFKSAARTSVAKFLDINRMLQEYQLLILDIVNNQNSN